MNEECLFCKIISGKIPGEKVYEDEDSFAFLDINPVNVGHTLLVPKMHYENIFDIPEELLCKIAANSKKLSITIKKALDADGVNVMTNNGKAAGQLVFHSHTHIVPRYESDGFQHWKGRRPYKDGEAKEVADKIKAATIL